MVVLVTITLLLLCSQSLPGTAETLTAIVTGGGEWYERLPVPIPHVHLLPFRPLSTAIAHVIKALELWSLT